jgi:hypothetical protein
MGCGPMTGSMCRLGRLVRSGDMRESEAWRKGVVVACRSFARPRATPPEQPMSKPVTKLNLVKETVKDLSVRSNVQ